MSHLLHYTCHICTVLCRLKTISHSRPVQLSHMVDPKGKLSCNQVSNVGTTRGSSYGWRDDEGTIGDGDLSVTDCVHPWGYL